MQQEENKAKSALLLLTDARRGGREQLAFCIARYDLFPHVCTRKHASAKNGLQERPLKKASYLSRVVIGYPFLPASRKRSPLYLFPSLLPVHRLLHLPSLDGGRAFNGP